MKRIETDGEFAAFLQGMKDGPEAVNPHYRKLADVLQRAFKHASGGKGSERHGGDKPIDDQFIIVASQLLDGSVDGQVFQVMKKAQEAARMAKVGNTTGAVKEMYGVINYAAAVVIVLEAGE